MLLRSGGDLQSTIISMLISLPGIVIGLSFHEFAHAWVSDKLGDPTPRAQGRLTLSPFAHVDPWGLLMLLIFGFGFAKPVQVNPQYYKNKKSGQIMVSLAGVTMNLIMATLMMILYKLLITYALVDMSGVVGQIIWGIISINIGLMVFNLLPIPPLDGYQTLKQLIMNGRTMEFLWKIEQYSTYILIAVLIIGRYTGFMGVLMSYVLQFVNLITSWI